jgi:hypothetical protein
MPTYKFKNKVTGEEFEKFMGISARDDFLKDNPDLEPQVAGVPLLGDPVLLGLKKPDAGFREVLQKIKSNHYKSTINTW